MSYIVIQLDPPKVILPAAIVRTLPGYKVTFSVTGIPPIYTSIVGNSTVLINTTNSAVVSFPEKGDYICVATSKYGTEVKEFSVVFNGKNLFKISTKLRMPKPGASSMQNAKKKKTFQVLFSTSFSFLFFALSLVVFSFSADIVPTLMQSCCRYLVISPCSADENSVSLFLMSSLRFYLSLLQEFDLPARVA